MKTLFAFGFLAFSLSFLAQADYECPMDMGEPEPLYELMAHIDPMVWEIPESNSKRDRALSELREDLNTLKKKYEAFHDSVYENDLKVSEEERKKLAEEIFNLMMVFAQKIDANKTETVESTDKKIKSGFSTLLKQMARTALSQSETLRHSEKIVSEVIKVPSTATAIISSFKEQLRFNREKLHKNVCAFLEKEAEACTMGDQNAPPGFLEQRLKSAEKIHSSISLFHESFDRSLRNASRQLERKLGAWKLGDKVKKWWAKQSSGTKWVHSVQGLDFENDVAPLLKLCGVQRALENLDPNRGNKLSAGLWPPASYQKDCARFFCDTSSLLSSPDGSAKKDTCRFVSGYGPLRAQYASGFKEWTQGQATNAGYNTSPFCPSEGVPRRAKEEGTHGTQGNRFQPR